MPYASSITSAVFTYLSKQQYMQCIVIEQQMIFYHDTSFSLMLSVQIVPPEQHHVLQQCEQYNLDYHTYRCTISVHNDVRSKTIV